MIYVLPTRRKASATLLSISAHISSRDDIVMANLRDGPPFAIKEFQDGGVGNILDGFERDYSVVEIQVNGPIDGAHCADTDKGFVEIEFVATLNSHAAFFSLR
jgi:hypothetical protein